MRMLTMKMPPIVTISMSSRSCQPASPATTPGSSVRSMLCHMPSKKPYGCSWSAGSWPTRMAARMSAASMTMAVDSSASQPMMAMVPLDRVFSNR